MTTSDLYNQIRLVLSRLNEDWSISGGVLSYHASHLLRRDIDERDMMGSVVNLIDAWTHIATAAGDYLDEYSSPLDVSGNSHSVTAWNNIFAGASDLLLNALIPSTDDRKETLLCYINESFGKAQAFNKQVMG